MKTVDDEFNDTIDELHARIDIQNEHCHLKHSDEDPAEDHPAIDYLCQGFGFGEIETESIRIPICAECVEALLGDEWILLYCLHCNSSQWVKRSLAKYQYPFWLHIKWMDVCPICYEAEQEFHDDHD